MSYLNQVQDPRRRNVAIAGVIAIHAMLGYALVTGLTFTKLVEQIKNPEGIIIPEVPLPPPPPPDPTPTEQVDPKVPVPPAPVPPIELPPQPLPPRDAFDPDTVVVPEVPRNAETGPIVRPDPPRPAPSFTPRQATPTNDPLRWITTEDYPAAPLRNEVEGTAGYRLIIGTGGRVSSCEITRSSGNRALDEATCRFITRRARFEPATDETGGKVVGSYTGSVRWEIPD